MRVTETGRRPPHPPRRGDLSPKGEVVITKVAERHLSLWGEVGQRPDEGAFGQT